MQIVKKSWKLIQNLINIKKSYWPT